MTCENLDGQCANSWCNCDQVRARKASSARTPSEPQGACERSRLATGSAIELDADGYPTDYALKQIAQWPSECGFAKLMETIHPAWAYSEAGFWRERYSEGMRVYELSTAGWSGNESIISAMQENRLFWAMCWHQSTRGGHHVFHLPNV